MNILIRNLTVLVTGSGLILALSVSSLWAAACCSGYGVSGLDSQWNQAATTGKEAKLVSITSSSYDSSQVLFAELNELFAKKWIQKTGYSLSIKGSYGSSGTQAKALAEGKSEAELVALDQPSDIEYLVAKGLLSSDWQKRLENNSSPFTTTVVFLVRKGNPKGIKDWSDLVKPGVSVITPDPKTSGEGRWNFLAAWGWAQRKFGSDEKARSYVSDLYRNVALLNSTTHGSAVTFSQKGKGDVLLVWESESFLLQKANPSLQRITPSSSILVEPPVTWLDKNVDKNETRRVSESYVKFLYSPEAQKIIARNYYRPRNADVAKQQADLLPNIDLFTVKDVSGNWTHAVGVYFADGAVFDQIYKEVTTTEVASHP